MSHDPLTAAVEYAGLGWSVHPLPAGSKKADTPWAERQRVRLTPEEVAALWAARPNANIAIITGGVSRLVVVDVDTSHGGDPAPFLGTTPLVARTRSGGWHLYYKHPGRRVQSVASPSKAHPGVDVRGDGGYVVAPPSRVAPGSYCWEGPPPSQELLAELPSYAVVEHLLAPPPPPAVQTQKVDTDWLSTVLSHGAPIGEQRQQLTRLVGYFVRRGLPPDVATALLVPHVARWKQDKSQPWTPHDIRELVDSIYSSDAGRGGGTAPEDVELLVYDRLDDFIERYETGEETPWVVEGWLPDQTVAMVSSPPGSYKTWLLCDLACSVASGDPFLGQYPVHSPGPVLFVQQEDPRAKLAERFAIVNAGRQERKLGLTEPTVYLYTTPPVYLVTDMSFKFDVPAARAALVQRLEELRPKLVILDPLYTAIGAKNYMVEMTQHLTWVRRLRDRFACAFLFAHHTKKLNPEVGDQGREQTWGSQLLNASIETGWNVRPLEDDAVSIRRHFKVAANIEPRRFTFAIDLAATPAFRVTESEVDESESGDPVDAGAQAIVAALQGGGLSAADIRAKTGLAKATVTRKLASLVKRGEVVASGPQRSRVYALAGIDEAEVS
jgi:hypothetical protein